MDAHERLAKVERLLEEAVFAARARQAAGVSLALARDKDGSAPGRCGLGREAAAFGELTEDGERLARDLWPQPDAATAERVRGALVAWAERQDQLDRDRNHFLKAFRQRHGFDRRTYAPQAAAEFEQGLADVNGKVHAERRQLARALLDP